MTGEQWAAERQNGVERLSLWADGSIVSEHTDCTVQLTPTELRALATAATATANTLEQQEHS
ncbi:hypothetical protein NYQ35_16000 [Curtobacterium flaccumfaciens pv. flaccumfaciens]|uniref:hypothetical protein n=1 Tax=Curtobacterium flaccumfaciens TaxID=2035 RepID=UPI00217D36BA|nr:hypothetical protein [Curtobacterium flaccumfaciens]MCS6570309.1 hypothetical protein [Curtobacterium flaccumfaciens pv. flaccumfaciens]MCS6585165.1 hypothetical protein [Curtobacterium flaccumfaciens pv. flaccumfaciens]